jgi:ferredoxin-NADP reductase
MAAQEIPLLGYRSKLLDRVDVAEGTMAFHFEKPSGFDFKPGQAADLTLLNPPENDSEGNTRTFSIASAPFESRLMFVTRMRDIGIGLAPFFSIVRQADHDRMAHRLYFFYSNRRPEDAPFLEVLENLEKTNPNFRFIRTMTEMARSRRAWNGETDRDRPRDVVEIPGQPTRTNLLHCRSARDGCSHEAGARCLRHRRS